MKKIAISVLLVNLLAGCASDQPKEPVAEVKAAPAKAAPKAPAKPAAKPAAKPPVAKAPAVDPLNDPNGILAKRSVFYPTDISVVQDADTPVVEAHAQYLSSHNAKIRLEGNCDERGSTEYNLALGQRRADGVKKMLQVGGVKDAQIDTVSYGEEKSRAEGHDEGAWAQNRRTDLIYGK